MNNVAELSLTRDATLKQALATLDRTAGGLLLLTDAAGCFERTITDGDLRRMLLDGRQLDDNLALLPRIESVVLADSMSKREALDLMNQHEINHLPVLDKRGRVLSVLDRKKIDSQILLSTPHMGDMERQYVEDAFKTNWIAPLGPNVDAFERELAALVGIPHAAAVNSGTAAIHLALRLFDIGPGDRVFCSSLTFIASANPIIYQGAEPVFIDSEPDSWNMSPQALEKAFDAARQRNKLPKAVIVVNLYGQSADMDPLLAICNRYEVPLIEDAAESLGAKYKGRASGTLGRIGIYSFNGNKIITTSGGGMLVSEDQALIEKARFFSTQARDPAAHYQHSEIGYNYRMSNILAGVGRGQLQVLEQRVAARRAVYQAYKTQLGEIDGVEWMPEPAWSYSTHWLSACTIDPKRTGIQAADLIRFFAGELIEARPVWKPMHLQPVFSQCEYYPHADSSVSDRLFGHGVCLPSGSNLTDSQIERVALAMNRLFKR